MQKKLLLFVHGLGGSGTETWRSRPGVGFAELIAEDKLIADQFDVAFYQYPTSLFWLRFFGRTPKIQELAEGLRTQIDVLYSRYSSIVLVCHSLDGLIARLYLINEVKHQRPVKVGKLFFMPFRITAPALHRLPSMSLGGTTNWRSCVETQI
jgi:triacylglycerol esterase/lipase EstA (alpha/beta hydrolase family)